MIASSRGEQGDNLVEFGGGYGEQKEKQQKRQQGSLHNILVNKTNMAEQVQEQYTSIDFLSKLRTNRKTNLFKQLSLDTDLHQLHQVLNSPRLAPAPPPPQVQPQTLDIARTKTFLLEALRKYETEQQIEKKWSGFLSCVANSQDFQKFVQSLKTLPQEPNPQLPIEDQPKPNRVRSHSAGRQVMGKEVQPLEERKMLKDEDFRETMRGEVLGLKDILQAGEKFLRT